MYKQQPLWGIDLCINSQSGQSVVRTPVVKLSKRKGTNVFQVAIYHL